MNTVTIVGNLTADPELRYSNNEKPLATFTVANSRRTRTPDGNWEDGEPGFYDCVIFGPLGEHFAESCRKGSRVIVAGRLQQRSWEADDGRKRSKVELVVDAAGPELRWNPLTYPGDTPHTRHTTQPPAMDEPF